MLLEWLVDHPLIVIVALILIYRLWRNTQPFPETPGVDSIHNTEEWNTTLSKNSLVLADFYATWCMSQSLDVSDKQGPPCRAAAPIFGQLAQKYKSKCKCVKVNVDQAQDVAKINGISAMPTFKFFRDGKELTTVVGWKQKEIEQILERETATQQ